jgi:cytochrome c oxidase subunit 1
MFISLIGFGFLGGISGVMMGTEQLNLIIHNTIYVPGHFHATVVVGTTLAFMGLTYFLIPVLFRRELMFPTMAKWQPYVFGLGMSAVSLFLMGAGTLGVPRRHWDIGFAGNLFPHEFPGAAWLMMALAGLTGIVAVIGGGMYLLITVGSVFFGKRIQTPEFSYVRARDGMAPRPPQVSVSGHGAATAGGLVAPGTFTLALVFLAAFVLYYFINWKYLSTVWPLK